MNSLAAEVALNPTSGVKPGMRGPYMKPASETAERIWVEDVEAFSKLISI